MVTVTPLNFTDAGPVNSLAFHKLVQSISYLINIEIQKNSMKLGISIVIIGIILICFGVIFQFQGSGQLGPESSFMYYNKDWIFNGIIIIISGIAISGFGIFLLKR